MNQISDIGFGTDINKLAGYATRTNDRLGVFELLVKNISPPVTGGQGGPSGPAGGTTSGPVLRFQLKEYDGITSPSGWKNVGNYVDIVAGGYKTIHVNLTAEKLGFFGSGYDGTSGIVSGGGATTPKAAVANVSVVMDNKSDLRGAQIDIVVGGRKGWGYDDGFDTGNLIPKWGTVDQASGNISGINSP